jgi:hypothetical protein
MIFMNEKVALHFWQHFCNYYKTVQSKRSPIARKLAQSGVDVMITIFGDFRQFSAKKLAIFSKTNAMIKILHNLALF